MDHTINSFGPAETQVFPLDPRCQPWPMDEANRNPLFDFFLTARDLTRPPSLTTHRLGAVGCQYCRSNHRTRATDRLSPKIGFGEIDDLVRLAIHHRTK